MKPEKLNLFIVANNPLLVNGLRHHLEDRFGPSLNISNFYNGRSLLRRIDENTQVVVMDHLLQGRAGHEILKGIKAINPSIEVIMHSTDDEVIASIEAYRKAHQAAEFRKHISGPPSQLN